VTPRGAVIRMMGRIEDVKPPLSWEGVPRTPERTRETIMNEITQSDRLIDPAADIRGRNS
jgi:hypothetical protein